MDLEQPFSGLGVIWKNLRAYVPEEIVGEITGMRGTNDRKGAVFDVEEYQKSQFEELLKKAAEKE